MGNATALPRQEVDDTHLKHVRDALQIVHIESRLTGQATPHVTV